MQTQPTMDLLPVTVFIVVCLIVAVFLAIVIRRTIKDNNKRNSP